MIIIDPLAETRSGYAERRGQLYDSNSRDKARSPTNGEIIYLDRQA